MAAATRIKTVCPAFGASEELPRKVLPSYSDLIKYRNEVKRNLTSTSKNYFPCFIDLAEGITREVEKFWKKTSIPTLSHNRVVQLLRRNHAKYRMLLKPYQARNKNSSYIVKLQSFQSEALAFFDICSCKSANIYKCACPKDCKVSSKDKPFLVDQKSCTTMLIGRVDTVESN